jgi:methionyl-tRNA synthetase
MGEVERVIVTAALPYANGEIHLGHVCSTYLPADIFVRYQRMKGRDAIYVCATDDFGTPILIRAEQEGKTPKEYVAYWYERDLKDFQDLGISFDIFHQTSSDENVEMTQYFFRRLYGRGYIYKQTVLQYYCEYDRKFLPDRYVIGTCPYCGAENQYSDGCEVCGRALQPGEVVEPRCAICGRTPVMRETDHYFFRLSAFSERLKRWLEGNPNLQPQVRNYVLRWIEDGLKDWDITRDIPWGVPIPLPEAEGKVLYGWFDNHLCYIASALLYYRRQGVDGKEAWNSAKIFHFIGKDIVYHHYLFLPAMRMGNEEEYKLPDAIPTRGHLLLQGRKFSKSKGWYVSLRDFLDHFPADYLRFYMAAITPYSQDDVNFDWDDFAARINNELVANIGNFIHRALTLTHRRYGGVVPALGGLDQKDEEFLARLKAAPSQVGARIEANQLDRGLRAILDFSAACNQYFQVKAPWREEADPANCLHLSINAVRSLAILLAPYTPFSAERIWRLLKLEGTVHEAPWDSAGELGVEAGHRLAEPEIPFRRVELSAVEARKAELGRPRSE